MEWEIGWQDWLLLAGDGIQSCETEEGGEETGQVGWDFHGRHSNIIITCRLACLYKQTNLKALLKGLKPPTKIDQNILKYAWKFW